MWTDQYCETRQCWDEPNWEKKTNAPRAYWMFASQHDKQFSKSLQGMVSVVSLNSSIYDCVTKLCMYCTAYFEGIFL